MDTDVKGKKKGRRRKTDEILIAENLAHSGPETDTSLVSRTKNGTQYSYSKAVQSGTNIGNHNGKLISSERKTERKRDVSATSTDNNETVIERDETVYERYGNIPRPLIAASLLLDYEYAHGNNKTDSCYYTQGIPESWYEVISSKGDTRRITTKECKQMSGQKEKPQMSQRCEQLDLHDSALPLEDDSPSEILTATPNSNSSREKKVSSNGKMKNNEENEYLDEIIRKQERDPDALAQRAVQQTMENSIPAIRASKRASEVSEVSQLLENEMVSKSVQQIVNQFIASKHFTTIWSFMVAFCILHDSWKALKVNVAPYCGQLSHDCENHTRIFWYLWARVLLGNKSQEGTQISAKQINGKSESGIFYPFSCFKGGVNIYPEINSIRNPQQLWMMQNSGTNSPFTPLESPENSSQPRQIQDGDVFALGPAPAQSQQTLNGSQQAPDGSQPAVGIQMGVQQNEKRTFIWQVSGLLFAILNSKIVIVQAESARSWKTQLGGQTAVQEGLTLTGVTYFQTVTQHGNGQATGFNQVSVTPKPGDILADGSLTFIYLQKIVHALQTYPISGITCFKPRINNRTGNRSAHHNNVLLSTQYIREAAKAARRTHWGEQHDSRVDAEQKHASQQAPPPDPIPFPQFPKDGLIIGLDNTTLLSYWASRQPCKQEYVHKLSDQVLKNILDAHAKVYEAARLNPLDELAQVKALLFYAFIFTPQRQPATFVEQVMRAVNLINIGDYSAFTCDFYAPAAKPRAIQTQDPAFHLEYERRIHQNVLNLIKQGRDGDAYQALNRDRPQDSISLADFQKHVLQDFPTQHINTGELENQQLPEGLPQELVDELNKLRQQVQDQQDVPAEIQIDREEYGRQIRSAKRGIKPGWDNCAAEHLKLLGLRKSSSELIKAKQARFIDEECALGECLINGKLSSKLAQLHVAGRGILIPKSDGTPRVVMPHPTRSKLAIRTQRNDFQEQARKICESHQTGFEEDATNTAIHVLEARMQCYPQKTTLLLDMKSAFPLCSRFAQLALLLHSNNPLYKFFRQVFGHENPVQTVFSQPSLQCIIPQYEGTQAGFVLGSHLFNIAASPYFKKLVQLCKQLDPTGYASFYHDDGHAHADTETVFALIDYLCKDEFARRLFPSLKKFIVILPKQETTEEAERLAERYVQVGLSPFNIKLHPDNVSEQSRDITAAKYGARFLGVPIGSQEFKRCYYRGYLAEMKSELIKLDKLPNTQAKAHLLRRVVAHKITHFKRASPCIPGEALYEFLQDFEKEEKRFIARSIFGVPVERVPELAWLQVQTEAGLSYPFATTNAHAAYLASFSKSSELMRSEVGNELVEQMMNVDTRMDQHQVNQLPPTAAKLYQVLGSYQEQLPRDLQAKAFVARELITPLKKNNVIPNQTDNAERRNQEVRVQVRQKILYAPIKDQFLQELHRRTIHQEDKARLWNLTDQACGSLWMRQVRMNNDANSIFNMETTKFRVALLRAHGIPFGKGSFKHLQPSNIRNEDGPLWGTTPLICNCAAKCEWDSGGQHVFSCAKNARQSYLHDSLRDELHNQCKIIKVPVALEVRSGLEFQHLQGRDRELKDADIAVFRNLPGLVPTGYTGGVFDKIAVDVKTMGYSSDGGDDGAFGRKYSAARADNVVARNAISGFYFMPFVVGCSGGMHNEAFQFLLALSKAGAESPGKWYGRQQQLLNYFRVRLSVTIAMATASVIMESVTQLRPFGRHAQGMEDATVNCFNWVAYSDGM